MYSFLFQTVKAAEATTDTDETYCIVTSKGLWLVAFDGSVCPTCIAYPTASDAHDRPPSAINTQSAKNVKLDPTHSSKTPSTAVKQTDNDQQVGNFAENDPVAKPLSNENKRATRESPESPGSKGSGNVQEGLPPDKGGSQMLPPTPGPKASHTSRHQSCTINSNGTETHTCIHIRTYTSSVSHLGKTGLLLAIAHSYPRFILRSLFAFHVFFPCGTPISLQI